MPDNKDHIPCLNCGRRISVADLFCLHCGFVLGKPLECVHHAHREASGVCVVCLRAFCEDCGGREKGISLCNVHLMCEVRDETVLVFETVDAGKAHLVSEQFRQAGLHPLEREEAEAFRGKESAFMFPEAGRSEVLIYVPFREMEKADDVLAGMIEDA